MEYALKDLLNKFLHSLKPVFLYGLLLLLCKTTRLFSQTNYNLIFDQNLTSISAAEDIIVFHKAIHTIENNFLPPSIFDEDKWHLKTAGILYRVSKTFLLDYPFDHTLYLLQHETFGHGAKYRQFGYEKNSYNITLPPPYGKGSGFAQMGQWKNSRYRTLSFQENMSIYAGGVEANTILAKTLTKKWLANQKVEAEESFLYLVNLHSITNYILKTKERDNYLYPSNDILNYLFYLNFKKGYYSKGNFPLQLDGLKKILILYSIDPFQYFATYAYLKYLWSGNGDFNIPMIGIGKIKYLPSFHLGLTPFGMQLNFEHYFMLNDKIINLQYSYGDKTFYNFWNQKIEINNLIDKKYFSYSPAIHFWNQPPLEIGGDSLVQLPGGTGGAIYNTFLFKTVTGSFPVNIYLQLGYKTSGYLEGEQMENTLITRGGLSFSF